MTDVANNCARLKGLKHVLITYISVTRCGYNQICLRKKIFIDTFQSARIDAVDVRRNNLKTVHAGLHCTDRIDLCYTNNHAFLRKRLSRTFTYVTVTDNQSFFTCKKVVSTTLDRIVQRMTAAVLVIVLRFSDRIVNVDGWNFKLAFFHHF